DGTVTTWNPDLNYHVSSLFIDGELIYTGGFFSRVNRGTTDTVRHRLAAFNISDGVVTNWDPNLRFYGRSNAVNTLFVDEANVYAGGNFMTVNDATKVRGYLATFNKTDGAVLE
ncbi:MAG: hypothetical protein KAU21_09595, partial [Gammaproteobacteria bacterium]|nr:hypothetical protein [Gammaproteobacteria bacterium]